MIRDFDLKDTQQILDIYNYYVLNTIVTFDIEPLDLKTFTEKLKQIHSDYPCIVFEEHDEILGYAYGSTWRPKPAYAKTVETTVYVKNEQHGKQIGSKLYSKLLNDLKLANYHVALGGLTLPNEASEQLHKKFNFEQVAHFKEVGIKFNTCLDVAFWQLKLR